ncbi:MAG: OST-HTH/LOTUS domain-containing protein [Candidatus Thiodiazotropha lotti]|nr:OST-HTH/LOTUS domain-containing protein [Candidatus Thiodiazotropha lotti]
MEQSQDKLLDSMLGSVSRKMGRCILRLQQYEILMKRLVAYQSLSGYTDELEENRVTRKAEVGSKTLGQLVGELTGSYLRIEAKPQEQTEDDVAKRDPTRMHIDACYRLELTEEDYQSTKEGLARLVTLRNELVHHFIERFDLSNEPGCQSAEAYLDDAYQTIDQQFRALRAWAESMDHAGKALVELMGTPEYKHWFMFGVFPGQEIDWQSTTIVQQLCFAERDCDEDGWTELAKATEDIRARWPEVTPKKYGCSSWRHVIHESGLFEIKKRIQGDTKAVQVWYRSK